MTTAPEPPAEGQEPGRPHLPGSDGTVPDGHLPAEWVVPDDPRDLELDRLALLRERALARRRARLERVFFTRRWHSHGISGPIVVACLLIVFIFAAMLALLVPSGGNRAEPALPLVSSTLPAGQVGSRLPVETLRSAGRNAPDLPTEALRPGVVLLLPAACSTSDATRENCHAAISNVTGTAAAYHYSTWLIGAAGNNDLAQLAETPSVDTYAVPLVDPTGAVLRAFPLRATPTAVLVDGHGLVQTVVPGVTRGLLLNPYLDRLSGRA